MVDQTISISLVLLHSCDAGEYKSCIIDYSYNKDKLWTLIIFHRLQTITANYCFVHET